MKGLQVSLLGLVCAALLVSTTAIADTTFKYDEPAPGNMRFAWIHGSISAKANTDVRVQVHRYNEHTYILRQNPAIHWEAPFMYLLFGTDTAILLDTGATAEPEYFPIFEKVKRVIGRWESANKTKLAKLVVLPLGDDESQLGGLSQFKDPSNLAGMEVVLESPTAIVSGAVTEASIDLGDRSLAVIATPGLSAAAVSIYDPWSDILFTGNTFYPGRLVIRDFAAYKASLQRLVAFADKQNVAWIAGGRIEMQATPGMDYRLRANYRPHERPLQMSVSTLTQALQIVALINGREMIEVAADFIVMNGVGRGARAYGWPVYTPGPLQKPNVR